MGKPSNTALRRRSLRKLVRRFTIGLGVAFAISPGPAPARDNAAAPRRDARALPPWTEPGGQPPPRSTGSAEVLSTHPAVQGSRHGEVTRLFPRAGDRGSTQTPSQEEAMASHPAGKGRPTVVVQPGDSLWAIAEERVGLRRTSECWPRIYAANRRTIGPDPSVIEPGQKLEVPKSCR